MFHIQIRRVSAGTKDSAIDRLRYIARTNRYAGRGDTVRHIRHSQHADMGLRSPGEDYWREADSPRMRTNGRLLFTIEIAIPRAFDPKIRLALYWSLFDWYRRISTGRRDKSNMPCTFAIHEGIRKDDYLTGRLPNPHAHILLSASINDGVQRSSQIWFRRANSKKPEDSGAPRSQYIGTKRWLLLLRRLWARVANSCTEASRLCCYFGPSIKSKTRNFDEAYRACGAERVVFRTRGKDSDIAYPAQSANREVECGYRCALRPSRARSGPGLGKRKRRCWKLIRSCRGGRHKHWPSSKRNLQYHPLAGAHGDMRRPPLFLCFRWTSPIRRYGWTAANFSSDCCRRSVTLEQVGLRRESVIAYGF